MSGFTQLAQSPTQRAECAQSCAVATLHFAQANHLVAQAALACAVDPAPCAQAIVFTDHYARPCQHRPVSTHVWSMSSRLRVVCNHRQSSHQELARCRPKQPDDGRHEHGSREADLGPVFSESGASRLLRGSLVAAEGSPGCSGERAKFGCCRARTAALKSLRREIRARLVPGRGRLVHSLLSIEQPSVEAIPRISPTKFIVDECLELAASVRSDAGPRTDGIEVAFIARPAQHIDTLKSLPSNPATPKSSSSTESVSTPKHSTSARLSSSSKSPSRSKAARFVHAGFLAGEGMDPGSILVSA